MKLLRELLTEALAPKEPSAESITLSKAAIKAQEKELAELLADYESQRTKSNKHDIDTKVWRVKVAQEHMELAKQYLDEFLPGYNRIKKELDAAHKANNAAKYSKALKDLKSFMAEKKIVVLHNRMNKAMVTDRLRLKGAGKYQVLLRSKLQQMRDIVEMADKEKKYVGKSDEDKASIAKRSAAMKARWGGTL